MNNEMSIIIIIIDCDVKNISGTMHKNVKMGCRIYRVNVRVMLINNFRVKFNNTDCTDCINDLSEAGILLMNIHKKNEVVNTEFIY